MTLRFTIPLAAACLAGTQAAALSCMAPDAMKAFSDASAAEEVYMIVLGTFSGGPGPRPDGTTNGDSREYEVTFEGHTVSQGGPTEPLSQTVHVVESCIGPWCAELQTDVETLTFLRVDSPEAVPVLAIDACYSNVFPQPTEETLEVIRDCFANSCTAS
ncbi:hypothetical protein [Pseudoruegeria sp. HB172150]|uniref:hypothetical protein n=1 Tax=Pseudoruegeria sp. HB172150 TaxID=2721164 RepID=UPI001552CC54|nr:hypothetical protein [Pseudoruegeria sp. HB172150]